MHGVRQWSRLATARRLLHASTSRPRQLPAVLPAASRPLRHFQCTAVALPPVRMGGGGAAKRGGSSGPGRSGSDAGSSSSQRSSQTGVPAAQLQQERPHAPPAAAEEQQASLPAPPPPHQRADDAAQLLPIAFADGRVTVGDGTLLLDSVTPLARVQHPAGTDMVLLSMQAAKGASSMEDFPLGKLHCKQWLCSARNKMWWMTPEWGKTARELPPETQFLLLELEDGTYAMMLPLISQQTFRGTLRPPRKGSADAVHNIVTLRMESGDDTVASEYFEDAILMMAGREPYALIEAAVTAAAQRSGGARPLRDKRLPPNINVFGWCSWDSFYSAVSASGLADAVQSLSSGGVPPRWVVIDDGWQCTEVDEPYRNIPTEQLKQQLLKEKAEKTGDVSLREAYLEGEMEALGQAAKEIPAGTAMGAYLQEIRASGPPEADLDAAVDYHALARQHVITSSADMEGAALAQTRHKPLVIRAVASIFQYVVGLIVGAFQALVVLFYQWVVDPAEHGTWPVRFFTYMATGPLKGAMLQFFADSTNFTRRLTDVRANAKFSSPYATAEDTASGRREDLRSVVEHLRKRFNVEYIYCWHGLSAYWSGVSPNAAGVSKYEAKLTFPKPTPGLSEIEPSMGWNPGILAGISVPHRPDLLFNDMHSYLAAAGISGVKVDCQAGVGLVGSRLGGGPRTALQVHTALEDSISANFGDNHAINCMCHSTENIYRWRDTAVARASDDFYPTDRASHIPHLAACAFNGLFLSPLALPDWDMFSSRHVAADIHAAARAVSGGPVYVSDAPGSHSFDVLRKLVLPDGSVLRALLPGRPTRDTLFRDVMRDSSTLLKVWNMNATTGVVGVFNLQGSSWDRSRRRFFIHNSAPPELEVMVRPTDVETFRVQLEAAGCDVEGALAAAAAAQQQAEEAARQTANGRQRSPAKSSSSSSSSAKGGSEKEAAAGRRPAAGRSMSAHSGHSSTASVPTTNWAALGASYMSSGGSAAFEVAPAGSLGALSHARSSGSSGNGAAAATVEDEEAESAGLAAGSRGAAVPDFAVYVGETKELHRVSWDHGVTVRVKGWHASVVTLSPICRYEFGGSSSAGLEFAPIGLANMLNGGGAVQAVHAERVEAPGNTCASIMEEFPPAEGAPPPEKLLVFLTVRGRGRLLAYSSHKPLACTVDGFEVAFEHEGNRLTVDVPQVGSLHAGRSAQQLIITF